MAQPALNKPQGDRLYGLPLARRRSATMGLVPPAAVAPTALTLTKGSGATAAAVASGGTGYVVGDLITLTGGTTSYPTILRVAAISSGAVTSVSTIVNGIYTVNPTNPVAQGSSTGAGAGATFTMTYGAGSLSSIGNRVQLNATNAAYRFTGNGPTAGANTVGNGTACTWEWCSDAPTIEIRLAGSNTLGMLFIDGVRANDSGFTTDASGAAYLYVVDFGGVRKPRTFKIMNVNSNFGGVNIGTADTIWYPNQPRRPLAWGIGDSYMYGNGADNISRVAFNTMCELLGLEPLPDGIGGQGWASTGSNYAATRVTAKLATLTFQPDYVFIDLGYNDSVAPTAGSLVQSAFADCVAAIRAAAPKAKIIAFGPATPVGNTTNLTGIKAALITACTTAGVTFIDVQDWVSATNKGIYTSGDNVHPTQAGHDYIGGRKAQAVAAYL